MGVFLQFIRPSPLHDHMGGLHAPGQEGVGLENGRLRASWQRHAPAPQGPWKGDAANRKCSKRTLSRLLAVALRMYLTLHLLLFEQSM